MKRTNAITEGAVLLALFAIFIFIALYIPIIGGIAVFFLPLPFIVYGMRHGLKSAAIMFVAALAVVFIIGAAPALPLVLITGAGGIAMGYFYRKSQTGPAIAAGTIGYTGGLLISYIIIVSLLGVNIAELAEESLNQSVSILESFGQTSEAQIEQARAMMDLFQNIIPAFLLIMGAVMAFISHIIAIPVLKRLRMEIPRLKPFREWMLPISLIWYFLIATILLMVNLDEGGFVYIAVINIYYVLQILLAVQGFSFIFFYFHQKKLSKAIPVLILISSLIVPILLYLIRILGIIDLGFQLRKRIKKK
ncbi:DUF2232 domain-containing protein [Bacillus lacus]|uniref:DUF2232 domain-containing protein n=1 Tax=Metabacillus lacus TaxID=1983721 RepID=A0A7X2M0N9_9BACI|nr:YybS family protein [Metabacillus lacus]MRX73402.1 DUF2232 domain-containing protein [Metabacillus lacus]